MESLDSQTSFYFDEEEYNRNPSVQKRRTVNQQLGPRVNAEQDFTIFESWDLPHFESCFQREEDEDQKMDVTEEGFELDTENFVICEYDSSSSASAHFNESVQMEKSGLDNESDDVSAFFEARAGFVRSESLRILLKMMSQKKIEENSKRPCLYMHCSASSKKRFEAKLNAFSKVLIDDTLADRQDDDSCTVLTSVAFLFCVAAVSSDPSFVQSEALGVVHFLLSTDEKIIVLPPGNSAKMKRFKNAKCKSIRFSKFKPDHQTWRPVLTKTLKHQLDLKKTEEIGCLITEWFLSADFDRFMNLEF
jgi:hypothetical protein